MNLRKIIKYFFGDIIRSKWIVVYTAALLVFSSGIIYFSKDEQKSLLSLMNIVMYLIPLLCMIFGSVYYYNSREFIEMLLTQPVKRSSVFYGQYFSLAFTQMLGFITGIILPLLIFNFGFNSFFLMIAGTFLIFIFTGFALLISILVNDKVKGIGILIAVWLLFAVFYDGIVLFMFYYFADYPLEKATIIASTLNPVDVTRTMMMLRLDISALFGYTGATFKKYFGSSAGYYVSLFVLHMWMIIPALIARKKFNRKNF
ncbi:MAG: ABC transporter permease [Bacteroidetes bacterium]|nr:ABC transporter permease [Bacteroidota bacterium]